MTQKVLILSCMTTLHDILTHSLEVFGEKVCSKKLMIIPRETGITSSINIELRDVLPSEITHSHLILEDNLVLRFPQCASWEQIFSVAHKTFETDPQNIQVMAVVLGDMTPQLYVSKTPST